MGETTRRRTEPTRFEFNARSIILLKLCSNMVRIDETRGRINKDKIERTFAGSDTRIRTVIEFMGFC